MEAYVERFERCLESYGANKLSRDTKRRILELSYQYIADAQRIELQQSIELTIESFKEADVLIKSLASVIKDIFPQIRLYKALAKDLYYKLMAYSLFLRTGRLA